MRTRVVEISEDGRFLRKDRGFLVVESDESEIGRVPLDDINSVIVTGHGTCYTNNLLVELANRNIILLICSSNLSPSAILYPVEGHHEQAGRIRDQSNASKPLVKRLWTEVVKAKIQCQASILSVVGVEDEGFKFMLKKIKSGDPDNFEAQAAKRYWPLLFGKEFKRDRESSGINSMLNYVYTILRSATSRAIASSGLHPSLGLSHRQRGNNFALSDDLMEPFRPIADLLVYKVIKDGFSGVNKETKPMLAKILIVDVESRSGISSLQISLQRMASSLASCFSGEMTSLQLPCGVFFDLTTGEK